MSIRDTYKARAAKAELEKHQEAAKAEHQYFATRDQRIKEISDALCAHIEQLFDSSFTKKYTEYTLHRWLLPKKRVVKEHLLTKLCISAYASGGIDSKIGRYSDDDAYEPHRIYLFYRNEADIQPILNRVVAFLNENDVQLCYDTRYSTKYSCAHNNNYTSFAPVTAEALLNRGVALFLEL